MRKHRNITANQRKFVAFAALWFVGTVIAAALMRR
jgi:hypothetical protein